ncbi:cupin-like domain-containing protein [Variovorax boronicumulans]|uniref:cupin-like domain-containing protein n=1 Tax=Variovorax boronicumulans TaxID=436515 RepID=UPI00339144DB
MPSFIDLKQAFSRRVVLHFLPGHRDGVVQFIVGAQPEGRFHAELADGIRLHDGVHAAPDASIAMTEEAFQALVEHPEQPLRCGAVLNGDRALLSLVALAAHGEGAPGPARLRAIEHRAAQRLRLDPPVRRRADIDSAVLLWALHFGVPLVLSSMLGQGGWRMPLENLREQFGELPLVGLDADVLGASLDISTFGALIRDAREGASAPAYSGGCALPGPMHEAFALPLLKPGCFTRPQLWMGRRDEAACTRLHRDFLHAFIGQVSGVKTFMLAPPEDAPTLYPGACFNMFQLARFDPFLPDFAKFPLAREARLFEVELQPGELLVLPAGWFHTVRSNGFVMSVNRFMKEEAWASLAERIEAAPPGTARERADQLR